jgi:uncharacterized protein (DUF58 family)
MAQNNRLFDDKMLRKLEQLTLSAGAVRVGALKGDRQSRKRGTSIEFADYRNYTQGDDLRRLDWNVFARLERPFIKVTHDEEDLAVHILVDVSTSMDWPIAEDLESGSLVVDENKLTYAFRLAGALGYIGLSSGDLVSVTLIDNRRRQSWGPFHSRQNGWPLISFLEANYSLLRKSSRSEAPRTTELNQTLREYALRARRPGLIVLISDLFVSTGERHDGFRDGLQALLSRGYEPVIMHTLGPDEVSPDLNGDLKLIDIETSKITEVTINPEMISEYLERLQEWVNDIRGYCRARGIHYIPVVTDQPWESLILQTLRREGITT